MAVLMRAFDWAQTPLGPVEHWPQSLRTIVSVVLASPSPLIVLWGKELVQLYNDGYRDVMGVRHPAGLEQGNRECWPEVWTFNEPIYQRVREHGETFQFTDQRLVLTRHGEEEEAYFTLSYSPVRDERGEVGGVLVTVQETTQRVMHERQLQAQSTELQALAIIEEFTRNFTVDTDPYHLIRRVQELLCAYLPRGVTVYYELDGDVWRVKRQLGDYGDEALQRQHEAGLPYAAATHVVSPYESGEPYYQDLYDTGTCSAPETTAHVGAIAMLPLRTSERVRGVLGFARFGPGGWTELSRRVMEAVVRSLGVAIERAEQATLLASQRAQLASSNEELQEARLRAEVLAALGEALQNARDAEQVAQRALSQLGPVLHAHSMLVVRLSGDRLHVMQVWGEAPQELLDFLRREERRLRDAPLMLRASQQQDGLYVDDYRAARGSEMPSPALACGIEPIRTPEGQLAGFLVIWRDAAARPWQHGERDLLARAAGTLGLALERADRQRDAQERAQLALLASQSRLRFALDAAGLGDWELDVRDQSATRSLRHDEIFGYPQGHPAWTYDVFIAHVLPEDREDVTRKYGVALERGEAWDFECRIRRADGEVRWIWARGEVLRSEDGTPTHILGLVQDITEGKLAEAAIQELNTQLEARVRERTRSLEAANEELEAFSYSVSHDLRTPVRHITGFTSILRKSLGDKLDEKSARALTVVEVAAERMNTLIDAMLDLSRTSRQPVRVKLVDLGALVSAVRTELESDVLERRVRWQVSELPLVPGDHELLRQAMLNLLSNALKYTSKQDEAVIEVWVEDRADEWAVFVRDNGAGFDPRYQDKLFGVFQRLHRHEEFEGVGVGLANVRRIVQRHGGRVWAEGKPGEGATFGFSLPKPR
ncbi:PAS domain S-box [Deinococcus peraridilitoris DSM 19664]|uniref:histidine kinase n=2 Tax=Deinococcus TaxID=1298 RepID=K9ZZT7_DEIPD|nr:PAS domain S-box [Deinococcus peraridilitoris DSM 19664]